MQGTDKFLMDQLRFGQGGTSRILDEWEGARVACSKPSQPLLMSIRFPSLSGQTQEKPKEISEIFSKYQQVYHPQSSDLPYADTILSYDAANVLFRASLTVNSLTG